MRKGLLLIFVLALAVSCIDQKDYNINSLEVTPSMAVPIAFGSLTILDLLTSNDSNYIKVDTGDVVYLTYSKELVSEDLRDLFTLPDKAINQGFAIPAAVIPPHNQDIHSDSITNVIDLGLSPGQLTSIDFKSGSINYSAGILPSSTNLAFQVLITSSDLKSKTTGQSLSIIASGTGSIPLSDYKVTLIKNKFNLKMVLVLLKSPTAVTIHPNTSVSVNFTMAAMDFNTIYGFFGDQTVNPPSNTLSIGAFGTTLDGANISFAQPLLTLDVSNDYGVPINVDFSKIEARKTGSTLSLQLNPASPVAINYPAAIGSSASTSVAVTNTKQVLDFAPTEIFYQLSARSNPGLTSGNDFMADTSKIRVKLNVNVPIYGQASGIVLRDTAKIDLSKLTQSQVQKASLRIDAINELPLDAKIQLLLTDDKYVVIDSLLSPSDTQLIQGSTVNATGDLETPGVSNKLVPLDPDHLNKIFSAKNLIILAVMNTSKDSTGHTVDVKFKSKYTVKINMGILADLNFNVKF